MGFESADVGKVLTGLLFAGAGIIAALGPRGRIPAAFCAWAFLFSGVADLAAWFAMDIPGNIFWPIAQLVSGAIPLLANSWITSAQPRKIRHPVGMGVMIVFSLLAGAVIAANVTIEDSAIGTSSRIKYVTYDFQPDQWAGKSIEATGLLEHIPALGSLTQYGGPTSIIFYTPNCNVCHEFFETEVPRVPAGQIIAIKVPAAEGVKSANSELPDDINCSKCTRVSLPNGPIWLIQSPLVLSVINGQVVCVAEHDQPEAMAECIDATMAIAQDQNENQIMNDGPPSPAPSSSGD